MEPQQVVSQFLQLPAEAQQIVADLIAYLDRREAAPSRPIAAPVKRMDGAILLPPLDTSEAPVSWPENEFADPNFQGGWADRTDITDSTKFVRELRRTQWGQSE